MAKAIAIREEPVPQPLPPVKEVVLTLSLVEAKKLREYIFNGAWPTVGGEILNNIHAALRGAIN